MAEEALPFGLAPAEAIAFFRAKGFEIGFDWRDVWQEEHARAFTVAKAMSRDLLEEIRAAVDRALAEGQTLQQFSKQLRPKLAARGWWGRAIMRDPATGEDKVVRLGSPARLRTIYETNLRTSYMAGRWQRAESRKVSFPFLRYVAVLDGRERDQHRAWHGTILPIGHEWWDTHTPLNGWGCRCDVQALNQRMLDRRGETLSETPKPFRTRDYVNKRTGEITRLEAGIDPGFSYNVGKASLDALTPAPRLRPMGGEGEELAAIAPSDAAWSTVAPFFATFGIEDADAATRGKVWEDAAGWPLAIALGLLRPPGGGGKVPSFGPNAAAELAIAAKVLTSPDRIGLVWVRDREDRAMLVRRYTSRSGVVDFARAFWRWTTRSSRRFDPGHLVWAKDAAELAAYDPHQARDKNGRWRSARGMAVNLASEIAAGNRSQEQVRLGPPSERVRGQLKALGIRSDARSVAVGGDEIAHILRRHGRDSRGQKAIGPEDIALARSVLNRGDISRGTPTVSRQGNALIIARAKIGSHQYQGVYEVRKYRIVLYGLRKREL